MKKRLLISLIGVLTLAIVISIFVIELPYIRGSHLVETIRQENVDEVQQMLLDGVDPNITNVRPSKLWSLVETNAVRPLSVACNKGNLDIVRLLLENGATAEYIEYTGWSPLRECLFYYHPNDVEIVRLLLENGADADLKEDEMLVFVAAQMKPKVYIGASDKAFVGGYDENTAKGISEIVWMLLGDKPINITGNHNKTLLIVACQAENIYLVRQILAKGCNAEHIDDFGKTALDYALELENEEIIALLQT